MLYLLRTRNRPADNVCYDEEPGGGRVCCLPYDSEIEMERYDSGEEEWHETAVRCNGTLERTELANRLTVNVVVERGEQVTWTKIAVQCMLYMFNNVAQRFEVFMIR